MPAQCTQEDFDKFTTLTQHNINKLAMKLGTLLIDKIPPGIAANLNQSSVGVSLIITSTSETNWFNAT